MFANDGFKIRGRDVTGLHVVVEDGTRWRPKPHQGAVAPDFAIS